MPPIFSSAFSPAFNTQVGYTPSSFSISNTKVDTLQKEVFDAFNKIHNFPQPTVTFDMLNKYRRKEDED
jgi:hypothetical protein